MQLCLQCVSWERMWADSRNFDFRTCALIKHPDAWLVTITTSSASTEVSLITRLLCFAGVAMPLRSANPRLHVGRVPEE